MTTSIWAICIAALSLLTTASFAFVNFRLARQASDRADAAEKRASASDERAIKSEERSIASEKRAVISDARSTERSRVRWHARLASSGYIIVSNESIDTAHRIRIEYSIGFPPNKTEEVLPAELRSPDAYGLETGTNWYAHVAEKDRADPGEVFGLPVPPSLPFSPLDGVEKKSRLGLRLFIEWHTELGSYKSQDLASPEMSVVHSGYEFIPIEDLPLDTYHGVVTPLSPTMTPQDHEALSQEESKLEN